MTPSIQIPGDNLLRNSLLENVSILLTLGNGKRKPIPDVINQALIDYNKIWKNTSEANELQVELPESYTITAPKRYGSWTSPKDKAGIGWALFNSEAKVILEGKAAIEPVNSPLEAEAEALRMAIIKLRKLRYYTVTFYGDSSDLYDTISKQSHQACHITSKGTHCPTHMKDIASLARGNEYNFCFQKIEKSRNVVADKLAKEGCVQHGESGENFNE
ncbi:hypothetical protein Bca101_071372 [Brassica carinata]